MKRIISVMLIAMLVVSFTACGKSNNPVAPEETTAEETTATEPATTADEGTEAEPSTVTPAIDLSKVENQQLTIGTASAGGAFYVVGTGIAEVISKHVPQLNVAAEITGGSVQNPILVGTGESDIGISNADHVLHAINGVGSYEQKFELSAIGSLHSSILHIVTLESTGIKTVSDLKGKKVAVGPAGGGSIPMIEAALKVYGMTLDDINASYLSYDDGISQLKDGQVDCALAAAGYPASAVMSLAATDKVIMVSLTDDDMTKISADNPYYSKEVVSKDVYKTDKDIIVLCVRNLLYCSPKLSNETVYAIAQAVYGNLEELKSYHNALSAVTLETIVDTSSAPLHPGAEMYFKDAGLLK